MARAAFTDGGGIVNGGAIYEWPIGFEDEDPQKNDQNLDRTALTSGEGFVRQQGAASPTVMSLKGWIRDPVQLAKMKEFYTASKLRTILFRDIDGTGHQVIITSFEPQRQRGRSGGTGLGYVWKYTIVMEVIS